jgi:hypothetical protein
MPTGAVQDIITSGNYGWVQTHGPAACLPDASNFTAGQSIAVSNATAGAVETYVAGQGFVGNAMSAGTSGEPAMVFLMID